MAESDNSTGCRQPWRFQPGQSGNPAGKPRGTVEQLAAKRHLAAVNDVSAGILFAAFADPEARRRFAEATVGIMLDDPKWFWRYVLGPLLPKNITIEGDGAEAMTGLYLSVCAAVEDRRIEQSSKAGGGEDKSETPSV